jgi:hypothetical protein
MSKARALIQAMGELAHDYETNQEELILRHREMDALVDMIPVDLALSGTPAQRVKAYILHLRRKAK